MGLLQPWALLGLAAAAVPILLHLFARREPPTVAFPAVRYLVQATREQASRLRLQHWLLLLLRTALIVALVLAAAGPTLPLAGVTTHAPTALAIILDNSASSGTIVGGTPRLEALRDAARRILAAATPDDALWLLAADGVPLRGSAAALRARVDTLRASPARVDLGQAVALADGIVRADHRPGAIAVLTDLQGTALGATAARAPVVVVRPGAPPPGNAGIASIDVGPQPWSPDGGRVAVTLVGDSLLRRPLTVRLDERPARSALGETGGAVTVSIPGAAPGWHTVTAELEPDELRADDRRVASVRIAPVARADCRPAGRWALAACDVLRADGRLGAGSEVTVGALGGGGSVVLPPDDPARLGALNRDLERRGVAWRFGPPAAGGITDSAALLPPTRVQRRHRLEPVGSGRTGVLLTLGGEPWAVRSGPVVLLGSRLEPDWTALPLNAPFVPLLDALANRVARGEQAMLAAAPGDAVPLPDLVSEVRHGDRRWPVEGGSAFRAAEPGIYFLVSGRDTVGALTVNPDARESRLAAGSDGDVRRLWHAAAIGDVPAAASVAFAAGARGDLRTALLLLALACALVEMLVAAGLRRPVVP